jgi:hypothetical protein
MTRPPADELCERLCAGLAPRAERRRSCWSPRIRSQREVLRAFPVDTERFRPAPRYDFSRPPHVGPLLYESRGRGVTGAQWRSLAQAQAALGALGLGDRV